MPRQVQDRTKINLHMQTRVLDGLKKIARVKGTTYSELIREACHRYVVAEGQKLLSEQKALSAAIPPPPPHWAPAPIQLEDDEEVLPYIEIVQAAGTIDPRERT